MDLPRLAVSRNLVIYTSLQSGKRCVRFVPKVGFEVADFKIENQRGAVFYTGVCRTQDRISGWFKNVEESNVKLKQQQQQQHLQYKYN